MTAGDTGNDFEEKVDEIEAEGGSTVYAKWTKAEDAESGEMASPIQTYTDVSIFDWYNGRSNVCIPKWHNEWSG